MTDIEQQTAAPPGCVLVLGMHRSGTSACAEAIAALGLDPGPAEGMFAPSAGNPRGYWEQRELVALNERILASWGASWFQPKLAERPPAHALPTALANDMQSYADAWRATTQPWMWKDPRLCTTLEFWLPRLPRCVAVVVERDPVEIAASLHARDAMTWERGLVLWEVYTRSLLGALRNVEFVVLRYGDLIEDPQRALAPVDARLRDALGPLSGSLDQAAAVVDPALRHARATQLELRRPPPVQSRLHESLIEGDLAAGTIDADRAWLLEACLQPTGSEFDLKQANAKLAIQERELGQLQTYFEQTEARRGVKMLRWLDAQKEKRRSRR